MNAINRLKDRLRHRRKIYGQRQSFSEDFSPNGKLVCLRVRGVTWFIGRDGAAYKPPPKWILATCKIKRSNGRDSIKSEGAEGRAAARRKKEERGAASQREAEKRREKKEKRENESGSRRSFSRRASHRTLSGVRGEQFRQIVR